MRFIGKRSGSPWIGTCVHHGPRAVDSSLTGDPAEHVVLYAATTWRAKAQPVSSPTGPVWTRSERTVDLVNVDLDLDPTCQ
jgi:hypothetical protein